MGRYDPDQGYNFDPNKLLVDPYARRLDRVFVRSPRLRLPREDAVDTAELMPKAIVVSPGINKHLMPRRKAPSADVRAQRARLHDAAPLGAGAAARHHCRLSRHSASSIISNISASIASS